ncbi:inverted formin-2-like [Babylonia areolata]|uniref:inverted formin-2-like n=1 Tax=Babylonia areolata TaxID=304850 RepID=UPI003FD0FED4
MLQLHSASTDRYKGRELDSKMMKATTSDSNSTLSSGQLEFRLDGTDAQACVMASHSPSVHVYYALRSQLERCSVTWLQEFVSLGGLDSLLDSLCQMTGKTFTSFSDAILQIDCISCIRAILNTHLGIDYLLQTPSAANKLVMGLEITNTLPKKQILEMLAAFCAHSQQGYNCILEGLNHHKRKTDQYHKYSVVVNELKAAETVPHKTAVMTFINTIINCNHDLTQRCRIRNQMIGLTLLDVINFLQREETDDDLHIQIQTFHDSKHSDEELLYGRAEVDMSSPSEVVEALQTRVFGTSRMVSMVNILQDLLAIEMLEKDDKDRLWDVVEQQVHHVVHSSRLSAATLSSLNPRQVDDLLVEEMRVTRSLVSQVSEARPDTALSPSNNNDSMYDNFNDKEKRYTKNKSRPNTPEPDLLEDLNDLNNPSPSAAPASRDHFKRPLIPDFPEMNVHPSRPSLPLMNTKAPSAFSFVTSRRGSLDGRSYQRGLNQSGFKMMAVPLPSQPMRNFKWVKIQDSIVEESKGCVWEPREVIPSVEPDYNRLETLFAETHMMNASEEVALLAGEVRLKINLFLNRLEVEPDELVRNLIDSEARGLTLPLLKYLHDIMPCPDEMVMLKQYNGSLLDIGMAEQFLLHLMDIPDYPTLMLGHLTRLQFSANISRLQRALRAMVGACWFLLNSQALRDLLHLVLRVGNFLNHGQFNGNARGLRLSSLRRLREVNSVETNHTLLHQVVAIIDDTDDRMFSLLSEIPTLDEAAKHSPEEIKNDVTGLNGQLKHFVGQLKSAHPTITDIFHLFLEGVKRDFTDMQQSIGELRELTKQVAVYVCEPTSIFNLQTCLRDILAFLKDMRKARLENTLFKRQRTQARRRSDQFKAKLKHKRLALEFGKEAGASSSMMEDRKKVVERILTELHHGNFHPVVPSSQLSTPEQEETPALPEEKRATMTPHRPHQRVTPIPSACATPMGSSPESKRRPLELSHISIVGTPMMNRPTSENLEDDLFHLTPKYPGKKMVMTSSANDLLDANPGQPPAKLKQDPKPSHPRVSQLTAASPPVACHHRSKSDLTDSILIHQKWLKYEKMKEKERKSEVGVHAPLAVPESSTTLATLNLEDPYARRQESDHMMMKLNAGPVVYEPEIRDKREKKGGIGGFFSRVTRAVLGSRSSANVEHNILRPSQTQEKRKNRHPSDQSDKENDAFQLGDAKRSSKRLGRFRTPKHTGY